MPIGLADPIQLFKPRDSVWVKNGIQSLWDHMGWDLYGMIFKQVAVTLPTLTTGKVMGTVSWIHHSQLKLAARDRQTNLQDPDYPNQLMLQRD